MEYTVTVEIKGATYTLSCDLNAMALVEEESGLNLLQSEFWVNISATNLRLVFWAWLQGFHPEITKKDTGKLIDMGNIEYITEKAMEVWMKAMPKIKGGSEKKTES